MVFFDSTFLLFMAKIALAMILGLLLGLERIYAHKTVGLRTYALAAVATAFFTAISISIGENYMQFAGAFNPAFIPGDIIVGIGFLGAGLIFYKDGHIENLTTAAGLWVCAGIGMAVGFGLFREAIFVTLITIFVLGILSTVERRIRLYFFPDPKFEKQEKVSEVKPRKRVTKKSV